MPTQERGATRGRILEVALALFSEHGYAGTSIRDIADRMAMTKAAVYYHFRSKEDLLAEVLEPAMTKVGAVLAKHTRRNDAEGRRELATALVDVIAEFGTEVAVMMSDPAAGVHLRALSGATGLPEQVGTALLVERSADPTRSTADRIRAASAVASLPAGLAAWKRANPGQDRPDAATKVLLVDIMLAIADAGSPGTSMDGDKP
jgi:AcrR family transcriptional regulator